MKLTYFIALATAIVLTSVFSTAMAQQAEYQTMPRYRDFRFSIGGGYAYRLGNIEKTGDAALDDMNKNCDTVLQLTPMPNTFF